MHILKSILCFIFILFTWAAAWAQPLYFIDVHSQIEERFPDTQLIIEQMDRGNVKKTILSCRTHKTDPEKLFEIVKKYPDRIIPAMRTKGKMFNKNHPGFFNRLKEDEASGYYTGGIAELLVFHAQKGKKAPEIKIKPTDDRLLEPLNTAIRMNRPLILHIEFGALESGRKDKMMAGLEKLVSQHPDQPFALIHLGQLKSEEIALLLTAHPNLYFIASHCHRYTQSYSKQPWTQIFSGKKFKPEWLELFSRHPDRFIFALDNVWHDHWKNYYLKVMALWQAALNDLPEEAAHTIAHGNAERLWHITD